MIANGSVGISEQEDGTYVYPSLNGERGIGWTFYVYKDGSAELYLKCKSNGALLGKPIKLTAPTETIKKLDDTTCDHDTEKIPVGDLRNPYKTDNYVCRKCGKQFRKYKR